MFLRCQIESVSLFNLQARNKCLLTLALRQWDGNFTMAYCLAVAKLIQITRHKLKIAIYFYKLEGDTWFSSEGPFTLFCLPVNDRGNNVYLISILSDVFSLAALRHKSSTNMLFTSCVQRFLKEGYKEWSGEFLTMFMPPAGPNEGCGWREIKRSWWG